MRKIAVLQNRLLQWCVACCLLIALNTHAQERAGIKKITGTVMASSLNRPIQDAIVYIAGTNISATSDNNGRFTIEAKEGDEFNPEIHEAIDTVENTHVTENTIAEILMKGYKFTDGPVIRHTKVTVYTHQK